MLKILIDICFVYTPFKVMVRKSHKNDSLVRIVNYTGALQGVLERIQI